MKPNIRFNGFEDEWVTKHVGDFLHESKVKGSNGKIAKKLTVKLWGKGVVQKREIVSGSTSTQYYIRTTGQFMYGKLDFLNQAFGIVPPELDGYESTLDSPAFDFKRGINGAFFLRSVSMKKFYKYQGDIADGSRKAKRIHTSTFFNMPVQVPTLPEQQKIGALFEKLDVEIAAEQAKINWLKEQKKGLLERVL